MTSPIISQEMLSSVSAITGFSEDHVTALLDVDTTEVSEFTEEPPTLDYLFPAVGTEDFRQRVISYVKRVWEWIERMYAWLEKNFDSVVVRLAVLQHRTEQALFDARLTTFSKRGSFIAEGYTNSLSRRWKPATDIGELTGSVTSLHRYLLHYYKYVDTTMKTTAGTALKTLSKLTPLTPTDLQALKAAAPVELIDKMMLKDSRDFMNGFETRPLLGNMRLVVTDQKQYGSIADVSRISIQLARATITPGNVPEKVTFPHFSRVQTENCLNQVMAMIKTLRQYFTRDALERQRTLKSDVRRLGQEISRAGDKDNADDLELFMRLMYARQLIDWTTRPWRSVTTHASGVLNGVRQLCVDNTTLSVK